MNIYVCGWFHPKNKLFLEYYVKQNNNVSNIDEADIVIAGSDFYDIHKYPTKKFILGPHYSVFPTNKLNKLNNTHKNTIYIQPSLLCMNIWKDEFKFNKLPLKYIPFGVDTNKFKPLNTKQFIFIYVKDRNPDQVKFVCEMLEKKYKLKYVIIDYKKGYDENYYLYILQRAKFGIWIGTAESQGFALQEALSCNVPLLVWNVKQMSEQWSHRKQYENIKSEVTSIPYWNKTCGEYFYEQKYFNKVFDKFILNLKSYQPRNFILNHLSMEKCTILWNNLIKNEFI